MCVQCGGAAYIRLPVVFTMHLCTALTKGPSLHSDAGTFYPSTVNLPKSFGGGVGVTLSLSSQKKTYWRYDKFTSHGAFPILTCKEADRVFLMMDGFLSVS